MLIQNKKGNYSFVRGIAPYSAGAIAEPGFEVVHVRFARTLPLARGFEAVEAQLKRANRPLQALCGMELRSPKPFTFTGFNDFNASYVDVLKRWDILVDGLNPVARTNVAPEVHPPSEPGLYAFSYTAPSSTKRHTFVVAGAGELPEGSLNPADVVRRGDTSADAIREKARFVMGLMEGRLRELRAAWSDVTASDIYTIHDFRPFLDTDLLRRMEDGGGHGLTWHYSRPPIVSIEYEMDLRGSVTELVI